MHAGAWFCPHNFSPSAPALPRSGSVQPCASANRAYALSLSFHVMRKWRIAKIVTVVLLLLCVATCLLWARSYRWCDYVSRVTNATEPGGGHHYDVRGISSENGRLTLYASHNAGAMYMRSVQHSDSQGPSSDDIRRMLHPEPKDMRPVLSFDSRPADPPAYRDVGWQQAEARTDLGILRWSRSSSRHTGGLDTSGHIDFSYWFLAVVTGLMPVWRCSSCITMRFSQRAQARVAELGRSAE